MKSLKETSLTLRTAVLAGLFCFQLGCADKCKIDTECAPGEICVGNKCEEGSRDPSDQEDTETRAVFEWPTSDTSTLDTTPDIVIDTDTIPLDPVDTLIVFDTGSEVTTDLDAGMDAGADAGGGHGK